MGVLTDKNPDCHWQSQSSQCGMQETRIRYNAFRVERRRSWSAQFSKNFGLQAGVKLMGGVKTSNNTACPGYQCSAAPLMTRYYTISLFDKVAKHYAQDIELFGYQKEVNEWRRAIQRAHPAR